MRALSVPELLDVWEQAVAQSPLERTLRLLAAACSETPDELAQLNVGQRDARLLTLREWTFGSQMVGLASCPGCGERLELTFSAADIRVVSETELAEVLSLNDAGYEIRVRIPKSSDLAVVASCETLSAAQHLLLRRCLLESCYHGEETTAESLPADIVDKVAALVAQADPQADVQLALSCPECEHQWSVAFDIESFFWDEVQAWAHRILGAVHLLASAYGWREQDILAMSSWRRQFYLGLVSQ